MKDWCCQGTTNRLQCSFSVEFSCTANEHLHTMQIMQNENKNRRKAAKRSLKPRKLLQKKPNPGMPWRRLVRCRRLCVGAWPWRRLRSVVLTKFELHVFCAPHVADHGEMFGVPGSAHCGKTCVFIQTTGTQVCLLSSCINNVFV